MAPSAGARGEERAPLLALLEAELVAAEKQPAAAAARLPLRITRTLQVCGGRAGGDVACARTLCAAAASKRCRVSHTPCSARRVELPRGERLRAHALLVALRCVFTFGFVRALTRAPLRCARRAWTAAAGCGRHDVRRVQRRRGARSARHARCADAFCGRDTLFHHAARSLSARDARLARAPLRAARERRGRRGVAGWLARRRTGACTHHHEHTSRFTPAAACPVSPVACNECADATVCAFFCARAQAC
jgi:hypothetical protein